MSSGAGHMIRYAIYTRQSVDKAEDFSSCEVQFMTCQEFARAMGEPGLHWTGQRFDDEGCSGATLDRPAMRRLRKVIDLGGIDRLYAVALDRLTRNMRDAVILFDELDKAGVELRLVHQPELSSGPETRFLRHILAAFAEFERDMIAARIAESRAYLKGHGRRLAGKVPYGYDADPVTRQLVPNAVEARRVRAIFARAARGQRPSRIAEEINALGWTTKAYTSRRSGQTSRGGPWTARQVLKTLRNPVYIGRFADGDTTRPGCHEGIVNPETFDAVQQMLDARRTTDRRQRTRRSALFRRKVVCPRCGRFLSTYQVNLTLGKGYGQVYNYYRCRSTAGGRPPCKGVQFGAYEVYAIVRDIMGDPDTWRTLLGTDATDAQVRAALKAWRVVPPALQYDFLRKCIARIELVETDGTASITFTPDAARPFLAGEA